MEIGESVDNDLRSAASRDLTLGRARAATEWLDDVGVLADTGCQGAATENTRKREEKSDAATATMDWMVTSRGEATAHGLGASSAATLGLDDGSVCCSVSDTNRAQLYTPCGEGYRDPSVPTLLSPKGTTPTATGVSTEWLDDVGISDCEPAAQTSTGDDIPDSRCTATFPCCIFCLDVCLG